MKSIQQKRLQHFLKYSPNPSYTRAWAQKLDDYCNYLVSETDADNISILTILAFKLGRVRESLLHPSVRPKTETMKAAQDVTVSPQACKWKTHKLLVTGFFTFHNDVVSLGKWNSEDSQRVICPYVSPAG